MPNHVTLQAGQPWSRPSGSIPYAASIPDATLRNGTQASRCTVSGEKAGRQIATYSAPSGDGEL
jgi:hypothetical protein